MANEVDPIAEVSGDDVAGEGDEAADRCVRPIAPNAVGRVAQEHNAGHIKADDVALHKGRMGISKDFDSVSRSEEGRVGYECGCCVPMSDGCRNGIAEDAIN